MAVDSPKDLLSVRDGSTIDSCRSSVDPRERHIVCKLDRYQLEDRYLRLLDEVQSLKKSSNTQEDKIKRLATKLMRATANPRACITALDISNDKDRISVLEAENSKLKDKISVLRSQLLNRKHLSRSLCGSRRAPGGTSSGATTCRSDIVRLKSSSCHCGLQSGNDANDVQNYTLKIEELEAQKKELKEKNVELQGELESYVSGNQREKVAENVEYIRLWRQMKQQTEQLVKVQKENKDLISLVNEMKKQVDEAVSNNAEVTAALVTERKKLSIMDEQMVKAKDSELSLREKDERIRDLMNELAILQQHNEELIKLSSKFGKMENENSEIKKRYTEHLSECQVLKSALSNEQANIAALQAANEQLLGKLHEYQILIDKLTIERMGTPAKTKAPAEYVEKKTSSTSTIGDVVVDYQECHKCCESSKDYRDKGIQTIDGTRRFAEQRTQTEECNSGFDQNQDDIRDSLIRGYCNQPSHRSPNVRNGNSALSRERMLKLLEQAQINTPLEAQNPIRIRQMETSGGRGPRQVSNLETMLFGDTTGF